jgi:hypothetical protein
LQHFSGVWRPEQARPNFLGGFLAREGVNSARTTTQKIEEKEIDLSYLACYFWEFRRAYLSLFSLYLGAILIHTYYSSISIPDLVISCNEVSYIFK